MRSLEAQLGPSAAPSEAAAQAARVVSGHSNAVGTSLAMVQVEARIHASDAEINALQGSCAKDTRAEPIERAMSPQVGVKRASKCRSMRVAVSQRVGTMAQRLGSESSQVTRHVSSANFTAACPAASSYIHRVGSAAADVAASSTSAASAAFDDTVGNAMGHMAQGLRDVILEDHDSAGADGSEGVHNLFSYCLLQVAEPRSARSFWTSTIFLIFLLLIQEILAFGFWDASMLLRSQKWQFASYQDPIPVHLCYSTWWGASRVPAINVLVSASSIILLGLLMRVDNVGTLVTHQLALAKSLSSADLSKVSPSYLERAWRAVASAPLFLLSEIRQVLFPCCAALGTSLAFSNSSTAQEIVLNSVAIGFVFELDDMLYPILIGASHRAEFVADAKSTLLADGLPFRNRALRLIGRYTRGSPLLSTSGHCCSSTHRLIHY